MVLRGKQYHIAQCNDGDIILLGAETPVSMGTMAAVTTVCIVVGIAVFALIAYFVIKRKGSSSSSIIIKKQ